MIDEIFQIKPSFHGIGVDLRALYRSWKARRNGSDVSTIAKRFLQLFAEHDVPVSMVPRLIPGLSCSSFTSEQTLLKELTPALLDEVAAMFAVRSAWLAAVDDIIYETNYCYKSPHRLLEMIPGLAPDAFRMPLRALATSKVLDRTSANPQRIELVAVESCARFDDVQIYRYHAFADGWDWRYQECRIQLKAMVRALRRPVPLYQVTDDQIEQAYEGRLFYGSALTGPLLTEPSLEDYALTANESCKSRESDEMPLVRMYTRRNRIRPLETYQTGGE